MSIIVQCPHCGAKNRIKSLDKTKKVCGMCKTSLPEPGLGHTTVLDHTNFDFMISNSDKPVLVDFWADWCGPCKMMAPVLEQLASSQSKVRVAKLDTEANQAIAARYGIRSIPTMILFETGREAKRISGAMPLEQLKGQIKGWM